MTRYYAHYFTADPMPALAEAEALADGTYVVEEDGPPRRFCQYIDNALTGVIYPGWTDPAEPLADLRRRREGIPGEIESPVEKLPDGGRRWRTWYVTPEGQIEKILEPEYFPDGRRRREAYRHPDGTLVSYHVFEYDSDGELLGVTTVAPDGTVFNRQHA